MAVVAINPEGVLSELQDEGSRETRRWSRLTADEEIEPDHMHLHHARSFFERKDRSIIDIGSVCRHL